MFLIQLRTDVERQDSLIIKNLLATKSEMSLNNCSSFERWVANLSSREAALLSQVEMIVRQSLADMIILPVLVALESIVIGKTSNQLNITLTVWSHIWWKIPSQRLSLFDGCKTNCKLSPSSPGTYLRDWRATCTALPSAKLDPAQLSMQAPPKPSRQFN